MAEGTGMESEECGGRLVTGQRREAALTESLVISNARIGMASVAQRDGHRSGLCGLLVW
jgi:hypothetical protein